MGLTVHRLFPGSAVSLSEFMKTLCQKSLVVLLIGAINFWPAHVSAAPLPARPDGLSTEFQWSALLFTGAASYRSRGSLAPVATITVAGVLATLVGWYGDPHAWLALLTGGVALASSFYAEPQFNGRNRYGEHIRNLLLGDQFTPESIERRNAVYALGPRITAHVRHVLNNDRIKIGLVNVGSSLRGYASKKSDIDVVIFILEGLDDRVLCLDADQTWAIDQFIYSAIEQAGYEPERRRQIDWKIWNYSGNASRHPDRGIVGFDELFLPSVYSDPTALERARAKVVQHLAQHPVLWEAVRKRYAFRIRVPDNTYLQKPHLLEWLAPIDPTNRRAMDIFNQKRVVHFGLPTLSHMAYIYLRRYGRIPDDRRGRSRLMRTAA